MSIVETLKLDTRIPKTHGWYENEWQNIETYPLFISFPRTGSHWINAVMELYFDRPRLPHVRATFMDYGRNDYMWFHDHDTIAYDKLHIENSEALYLYRDPVDTVFSYLVYEFNNGKSLKTNQHALEGLVSAAATHYKNHLIKWLITAPAKTVVKNERFKSDPEAEFSLICDHFGVPFDSERAKQCFDIVTPRALSERKTEENTLSDFMLTEEYKQERGWFRDTYGELINNIVISEKLQEWYDENL